MDPRWFPSPSARLLLGLVLITGVILALLWVAASLSYRTG
jgi:hypothetical protein